MFQLLELIYSPSLKSVSNSAKTFSISLSETIRDSRLILLITSLFSLLKNPAFFNIQIMNESVKTPPKIEATIM